MRRPLGLLAATLVLSSCTGSSQPKGGEQPEGEAPVDAAASRDVRPASAIWRWKGAPVAAPVVVGGTAVVIARSGPRRLRMLGIDLSTGEERWSWGYSPGDIPTGYVLSPAVTKSRQGRVVALQELGSLDATDEAESTDIKIIDPTTGGLLQTSEWVRAVTPLESCQDGRDVCATMQVEEAFGPFRYVIGRDRLFRDAGGVPDGARPIADKGLYATNARPAERVGRMVRGEKAWERPVAEIFGSARSSDYGWSLEFDADSDAYVGSLGRRTDPDVVADYQAGLPVTLPLGSSQLVGFRADDGRALWKRRGAKDCFGDSGSGRLVPVRCVLSGSTVVQKGEKPIVRRARRGRGVRHRHRRNALVLRSEPARRRILRDQGAAAVGRS
jgi:outer membrane protein assembly factor BamB